MKAFIVAFEFPYPANHGGKIDVWNRILVLRNAGVSISMLTWYNEVDHGDVTDEHVAVVRKMVDHLILIKTKKSASRIIRSIFYPSSVAARILGQVQFEEVARHVQQYHPDCIFIDGLYAAHTGLRLARRLTLPVYLRSHNIEHKYMLGQYKMSYDLRTKISILANLINLKKYEMSVIGAVDAYFDCSVDDLEVWKGMGFRHGHWLPPIIMNKGGAADSGNDDESTLRFDVGYIGNLNTPNNVEGILWFVHKVLPLLQAGFPGIRVVIAGSRPAEKVLAACNGNPRITLIPNPEDMAPIIKSAEVLINPLQFGSGVNIKSLEMLFSDKQVVSTSVGVKGMPPGVKNVFFIADTCDDFAAKILDIIFNNSQKKAFARKQLRKLYKEDAIDNLLSVIGKAKGIENEIPLTSLAS